MFFTTQKTFSVQIVNKYKQLLFLKNIPKVGMHYLVAESRGGGVHIFDQKAILTISQTTRLGVQQSVFFHFNKTILYTVGLHCYIVTTAATFVLCLNCGV